VPVKFLNEGLVLRLNRMWQPIGASTVKDALTAMCSGDEFVKAAIALNIEYGKNGGEWDFSTPINIQPTPVSEWMKLPIRDYDLVIHTSKSAIRVPTVIVAHNFDRMPKVTKKANNKSIVERDGHICQVSGKKLSRKAVTIDHLIPKSRGGKNIFTNMVVMDKALNAQKGDKTLDEMGWMLIRKPTAPLPVPISATIKVLRNRDWKPFLML